MVGSGTVLKTMPTTDAGGWCEQWAIWGKVRAQKEGLGSSVLRCVKSHCVKRFCLFLCRASSLLSSRGNSSAVLGQWSACGACGTFRSSSSLHFPQMPRSLAASTISAISAILRNLKSSQVSNPHKPKSSQSSSIKNFT